MGTYIETANDRAPNMMPHVHFACNLEHTPRSIKLTNRNGQQQNVQACCPVNFELIGTDNGLRCIPTNNEDRLSRLYAPWCEPWKVHESTGTCVPPNRNLSTYSFVQSHNTSSLDKLYLK